MNKETCSLTLLVEDTPPLLSLMVLVDGDHHGKGYVTPIVVNANEILFLPIRRFFVKVITPSHDFAGIDWSAQQSQGDPFA